MHAHDRAEKMLACALGLENRRMEYSKSRCQNSDLGKKIQRKVFFSTIYGDIRLTEW